MSFTLINVGTVANDHTGDPFRTAFQKTNVVISALNDGGVYTGPLTTAVVGLTIDQGAFQSNANPGLLIKGNSPSNGAGICLAGRGSTPGISSFDIIHGGGSGNALLTNRQTTGGMLFATNSITRLTIGINGDITAAAPTTDVRTLTINGTSFVGGGNPPLRCNTTYASHIAQFNADLAGGGMCAWLRSGTAKFFIGDSSAILGGQLDDYAVSSNAGLALSSAVGSRIALSTNSSGAQIAFQTNSIVRGTVASTGVWSFATAIGVNNATPPTQVTGWGVPTGPAVVNNFSGAAATLVQCSNAIAQIITDLKNLGFYGT